MGWLNTRRLSKSFFLFNCICSVSRTQERSKSLGKSSFTLILSYQTNKSGLEISRLWDSGVLFYSLLTCSYCTRVNKNKPSAVLMQEKCMKGDVFSSCPCIQVLWKSTVNRICGYITLEALYFTETCPMHVLLLCIIFTLNKTCCTF